MPQDDDIAKAWKSFSPERRDTLLKKMTPEQKHKLRTKLETPAAAAPQENTPGFFKRAAQGLGIPSSQKELQSMQPSTAEMVGGPAVTAGKMAYNYGKNLLSEGRKYFQETKEVGENIGAGGPVKENLGKFGAAYSDMILKGVLSPVGGGAISAWGEDIHGGNYSGAAGDAIAVLVNALMLKGATKPKASVRANKIAFAADVPETMDAQKQIMSVLPDLDKASAGKPSPTVGEMLETVNKAKAGMNNEVGRALFPIRGRQYVPTTISDAIKSHITADMQQTQAGRQMAAALSKAAIDYQKPWTFEQLNAARVNSNARMQAFYKKGSSGKYADMKNDVGVIVDREVARGVQDVVYPAMDQAVGKPAGYFANLLNRQGTLIQLGDALNKNAKALATRTAKIKGSPRLSTENVSAYGHPATSPGISVHRLQNVVVRPNPLARANRAVARASGSFQGSPVSHAGIYSLPVRELLIQNEDEKQPVQNRKEALDLLRAPQ